MSDEPKKPDGKRWGRWLTWAWIAVALLLVYVLSIGPAIWFSDRGMIQKSVVLSIHAPVYWVYERAPVPIQSEMDWYGPVEETRQRDHFRSRATTRTLNSRANR